MVLAIILAGAALIAGYQWAQGVGLRMSWRAEDSAVADVCQSERRMHQNLEDAASPYLQKLAEYEAVCSSGIVEKMSFFAMTPTSSEQARTYARDVSAQLREFAKYGISPVVFFEPITESGLVDMQAYQAGHYDAALDAYFAALKSSGVTDTMMGIWVPLPEGNLPMWSSVTPDDFTACVTKAVGYQKKHFPGSMASILLDTNTYPLSGSWTDGRAVSLLPYVQHLPKGLIDSFGLQGLPWSPAANEAGATNGGPQQYLRTDLAVEAARALGVEQVWLNTGTFGVKYANQSGRQITKDPEERRAQLQGVLEGVRSLREQNFTVAVHLFAEDKSAVSEATDWSYWPDGKAVGSASTIVFKAFVHDLQTADVPLWLYDTY